MSAQHPLKVNGRSCRCRKRWSILRDQRTERLSATFVMDRGWSCCLNDVINRCCMPVCNVSVRISWNSCVERLQANDQQPPLFNDQFSPTSPFNEQFYASILSISDILVKATLETSRVHRLHYATQLEAVRTVRFLIWYLGAVSDPSSISCWHHTGTNPAAAQGQRPVCASGIFEARKAWKCGETKAEIQTPHLTSLDRLVMPSSLANADTKWCGQLYSHSSSAGDLSSKSHDYSSSTSDLDI